MEQFITVKASRQYDIVVGDGILRKLPQYLERLGTIQKAAVFSDEKVFSLYGEAVCSSLEAAGIKVFKMVFPQGEGSKSLQNAEKMFDFLSENQFSKSDPLIALGGGVVGDVTGFTAANYLRGVPFIQIPTTLLAQVDSSVGGKTAVNIVSGKNLVGAFWQPSFVLCDTDTLKTLSPSDFCSGMGEVIKYGFIEDEPLCTLLESQPIEKTLGQVICRCIEMKRDIVELDEYDSGVRMILNFGHTLGHAVEKESGFSLSHGSCVAIGMAMITTVSETVGLTKPGTLSRMKALLTKYGLPCESPYPLENLTGALLRDKKVRGGTLHFILLSETGKSFVHAVETDKVPGFLAQTHPAI